MNRFEDQTERQRRSSLRMSVVLLTLGGVLLVAALAILGYSSGAPQSFWTRAAVGVAILLLVLRQVGRHLGRKRSKAVKPDDQSMLHLE